MPLTLAIMPALMVVVEQQIFALPLASVAEILDMDLTRTNVVDGQLVVLVRDRTLPLFYMQHWLTRNGGRSALPENGHVVVAHLGNQCVGLVVDQLIGQEEVVIKPLGSRLHGTPGLAGATITGDGACFLGVAVFGPIPGILIAILIALGEFVGDAWRPDYAVLGRAEGVKGYHDIKWYPDARLIPGLVLFRWDAPLFFANAEQFKEQVLTEVNQSPTPVKWFMVAAEPITGVDVSAADMLVEPDDELQQADIQLMFTEMKDPVKEKLARYGFRARFDDRHIFPTVGEAVNAYLEMSGVHWEDWEDRKPSP